jgi:peptide/nickel transport system substrate-binding protein
VNRARALLREAGMPNPTVNLMVPNSPDSRQAAEVIQSLTREAGFDVRIQAMEFASSLNAAERGDFEVFYIGWSGRTDPDGNIYSFASCRGPLNYAKICREDLDRLLNESRVQTDQERRMAIYEQVARITLADRPIIYLFHRRSTHAFNTRVQGFTANPDGLIRLQGVRIAAN